MEELAVMLIILVVGCLICGPIALIISIIALSRINNISPSAPPQPTKLPIPELTPAKTQAPQPVPPKQEHQPVIPEPVPISAPETTSGPVKKLSLEQAIGTKWILIAGVIAIIVSVGFFLKYAYDNEIIGPMGRVTIAAICGLIALAIGEVTRRRGYEIVAKGVSALGFAILYATIFSAYRIEELLPSTPALAIAILITAAAMLYAVALNEIVIAFLSLLGGFLNPVVLSTNENLPIPLFTYILVLGIGAMLCAYYRRWRPINILCLAGTMLLYTGWFEKFYRITLKSLPDLPEQTSIAIGWLTIFFIIYLIVPLLYQLVHRVKARKEDIVLVIANASITFYYLCTILFKHHRTELAFFSIGLCFAHMIMLTVITKRCKDDLNLRLAMLAISLFFLTVAIPLYLKMYAVAIAWSAQAVVLIIIGLRYRSIWTQIGGAIAMLLSLYWLLYHLPLHSAAFSIVFNPAFGTWCFVFLAIIICHLIYRNNSDLDANLRTQIAGISYIVALLVLTLAAIMEWYWHCEYNIADNISFTGPFAKGVFVIASVALLLFTTRPLRPQCEIVKIISVPLTAAAGLFAIVAFSEVYRRSFVIFANVEFMLVILFVASLFLIAYLFKRTADEQNNPVYMVLFALSAVAVLWVILTEQVYLYWYCRNRYADPIANWNFQAQMCISIMWALYGAVLMVIGFWRKLPVVRYMALGLFALLVTKVFIYDTAEVRSVYRITAFLATGLTLVAVSYLYQFLKKQGFFESFKMEKILKD